MFLAFILSYFIVDENVTKNTGLDNSVASNMSHLLTLPRYDRPYHLL